MAAGMHRFMVTESLAASLFQAVMSASCELLTTEASRRRLRMELSRPQHQHAEDVTGVTAIAAYKKRISG